MNADIEKDIQEQVEIGFSEEDILENLNKKYSKEELDLVKDEIGKYLSKAKIAAKPIPVWAVAFVCIGAVNFFMKGALKGSFAIGALVLFFIGIIAIINSRLR